MIIPSSCPICNKSLSKIDYTWYCSTIFHINNVPHFRIEPNLNSNTPYLHFYINSNNKSFYVFLSPTDSLTKIYSVSDTRDFRFILELNYIPSFNSIVSHLNTIINFS